jgi:hypothetical protein
MATTRRPLVLIAGMVRELPAGDLVAGAPATDGSGMEPEREPLMYADGTLVVVSNGDLLMAR